MVTTQEKLAEVERLIAELRQRVRIADMGRGSTAADRRQLDALKAIAADLRGRLDRAPSVAMAELERAMVALQRARSPQTPYPEGKFFRLGEELIARWPVVKQSLERFGAEVEGGVDG